MNGHDDEPWRGPLLQRPPDSGLSEEGFRQEVLERLPPRERPVRRVVLLAVAWVVAAGALGLTSQGGHPVSAALDSGGLLVPSSLGAALLWYLRESFLD